MEEKVRAWLKEARDTEGRNPVESNLYWYASGAVFAYQQVLRELGESDEDAIAALREKQS